MDANMMGLDGYKYTFPCSQRAVKDNVKLYSQCVFHNVMHFNVNGGT